MKLLKKIEKSKSVYLIVHCKTWCIKEFKWTGKTSVDKNRHCLSPQVYFSEDLKNWHKISIYNTTVNSIYDWCFSKALAQRYVDFLNSRDERRALKSKLEGAR